MHAKHSKLTLCQPSRFVLIPGKELQKDKIRKNLFFCPGFDSDFLGFLIIFFYIDWTKTSFNMKNLRILPLLLLLVLLFRCDLIDEIKGLDEIDFEIELYASRDVNIEEDDPDTINDVFEISATSNADVAEYLNEITAFEIWNIYIKIPFYNGEDGIQFIGKVNIGGYDLDFTQEPYFVPSELYNSGGIYYLALNEANMQALNKKLMDEKKLACSIVGKVSGQPVAFTMDFYIDATVYAEIKK
jgi:hypothetical protein